MTGIEVILHSVKHPSNNMKYPGISDMFQILLKKQSIRRMFEGTATSIFLKQCDYFLVLLFIAYFLSEIICCK